jgi:hypothetical protein
MRCVGPNLEKHRTFEYELVLVFRLAQAVEKPLHCVTRENKAKILAGAVSDVQ